MGSDSCGDDDGGKDNDQAEWQSASWVYTVLQWASTDVCWLLRHTSGFADPETIPVSPHACASEGGGMEVYDDRHTDDTVGHDANPSSSRAVVLSQALLCIRQALHGGLREVWAAERRTDEDIATTASGEKGGRVDRTSVLDVQTRHSLWCLCESLYSALLTFYHTASQSTGLSLVLYLNVLHASLATSAMLAILEGRATAYPGHDTAPPPASHAIPFRSTCPDGGAEKGEEGSPLLHACTPPKTPWWSRSTVFPRPSDDSVFTSFLSPLPVEPTTAHVSSTPPPGAFTSSSSALGAASFRPTTCSGGVSHRISPVTLHFLSHTLAEVLLATVEHLPDYFAPPPSSLSFFSSAPFSSSLDASWDASGGETTREKRRGGGVGKRRKDAAQEEGLEWGSEEWEERHPPTTLASPEEDPVSRSVPELYPIVFDLGILFSCRMHQWGMRERGNARDSFPPSSSVSTSLWYTLFCTHFAPLSFLLPLFTVIHQIVQTVASIHANDLLLVWQPVMEALLRGSKNCRGEGGRTLKGFGASSPLPSRLVVLLTALLKKRK